MMQSLFHIATECFVDKRRFAGARYARDRHQGTDRKAARNMLEIASRCPLDDERLRIGRKHLVWCLGHLKSATQIRARFGCFARADVFDFTLTDNRAALRTGSRSHIHHPVGRTNHLGVMLNHDDCVAGFREFLEHLNDASRIALMQANPSAHRAHRSRPSNRRQAARPNECAELRRPKGSTFRAKA